MTEATLTVGETSYSIQPINSVELSLEDKIEMCRRITQNTDDPELLKEHTKNFKRVLENLEIERSGN